VGLKLRAAAALLVSSSLLALCFRGLDATQCCALLARADAPWLLAAILVNAAIPVLWAAQWWLFLPARGALGLRAMFGITSVMAMVANSVPMLLGQVTGVHLLATRGRIGHPHALSVIALDQLAEGLAKLTVLFALASITPLPTALRRALWVLSAGVAVLLAVVVVGAWSYGRVRLPRLIDDWAAGLRGAIRPGAVVGGLALGLAMKCAEMGGILAVQHALGVDLPLWSALAVLAAVNLSTMISVAPGNVGVYEGSAYLAYTALGVAPEAALGLAVLQHIAYLIPMAGTGWITVLVTRPRQAAAIAPPAAPLDRPLRARS
jgi:uncharacterized membrane protein YbhN (UPF0104 family)